MSNALRGAKIANFYTKNKLLVLRKVEEYVLVTVRILLE